MDSKSINSGIFGYDNRNSEDVRSPIVVRKSYDHLHTFVVGKELTSNGSYSILLKSEAGCLHVGQMKSSGSTSPS